MKKIPVAFVALIFAASCTYDKDLLSVPDPVNNVVSFNANVNPIIQNNCFSCHNNQFSLGNLSLEGYTNLQKVALNGKLLSVINRSPGFPAMPKNASKLDNNTIAIIKQWVDNGAPNN